MRSKSREGHQTCLENAFRYLSYRPRSEVEMRSHFQKKGFDARTLESTMVELRRRGLLDDAAFARFWIENRESFSPRSKAMLRWELSRKGIAAEAVAQATEEIDDEESATRAAVKIAGRLSGADYETFRQRMGTFLKRRGFRYEVAQHTISSLWQGRNDDA